MIYYSNRHVDFASLDCGWLCVSLSVQNAKKGAQLITTYCRYVVYHNAVIVYLAATIPARAIILSGQAISESGYHKRARHKKLSTIPLELS